jgi:hypothetical protein
MPITDMPNVGYKFIPTTTLSQETRPMPRRSSYFGDNNCFTLTAGYLFVNELANNFFLTTMSEISPDIERQLLLLNLSQNLFNNSKPFEGEGLRIMNETRKKFFSKTPTRL